MESVLEKRKEKAKELIIKHANYLQYIALAIIVYISAYIRSRNLELLKDATTGKYISLELDSTLFLRYAEYIAEHGKLYAIDTLRGFPFGIDISGLGTFASYFVAYTYRLLHIFNSSLTVAYVNNIYPIIATAIMTIFMFLLLRRLFNYRVALVATLLLNVIPAFLFRSLGGSSDHDILGMMFIFMAFYFYVAGWQSTRKRFVILFGASAGISTGLSLFTAGSSSFIFVIIGIFNLVELFLNKFEKKDYYLLLSWLITSSLILEFRSDVSLLVLFFSVSTGTAYLALLVSTIDYFFFKKNYFIKIKEKYSTLLSKLPDGVTSFLIAVIFGFILSLIIAGPKFILGKLSEVNQQLFKAFSLTRWTLTVAENKRPYVTDWFGNYGGLFVYLFIIGSIVLFYYAVKSLRSAKKLTVVYTIFIFGYIFSRYSSNPPLNGETTLAKIFFFGSLLLFAGVLIYGYLSMFYKKHNDFENISKVDKRYTFVLAWFIVFVFAATSAIRLLFEFSTITSILVAFLIIKIFDYFWDKKENYYRIIAVILLVLILFSPFSFAKGMVLINYERSLGQAQASGPGYHMQWQYAGQWARENTPENAGFIHWWDYGYWVQEGFERPTVTDGGNFFTWWNYLTGRHLLTGQSQEEPLKFLKARNVSYFLAVADEIGKYPAYSSIGSDENYDRYSYIGTFTFNPSLTEEKRNSTVLAYTGGFTLDEDLVIDGKILPAGGAGIGGVLVPVKLSGDGQTIEGITQPTAIIAYQNQRIDLPMRCVYLEGYHEFENYALDSCLRVIPIVDDNGNINRLGAGMYLTKRVYHGLFAQLYLLNKPSEYFKLVYDDSNQVPLAYYRGRLIGPIRIWEINVPKNITLTEEEYVYYTREDYPNINLLKPQ